MNLRDIDFKILFELMKNSRSSDRQIAKKLGSSQPTVTRRRNKLEKELINGYTIVPNWEKLGYELLSIILVKSRPAFSSKEKYKVVRKRGIEWLMKQPNIIMGGACEGMGVNSFMISLHKNYGDYDIFIHKVREEMGDLIDDIQTIHVNLTAKERLKNLDIRSLAQAK